MQFQKRIARQLSINHWNFASEYHLPLGVSYSYIHQVNYKRDEEGNYVMKDPTQGLLFSNLVIEEIKIDDPYGVLIITFKENMGGQINTLRTKEDYEQIVKACKENTDDRIQSVIVKRYIQGKEGKKGRFKKIELLSS